MVTMDSNTALNDVIQAINSTLDLDEVLRIVMDTIIRLMNFIGHVLAIGPLSQFHEPSRFQ